MGAVFIKILNMSLTAGWIVLAVLLVRLIFKKKAPKALFPILWALVAVRLVCPVTIESYFSLIRNPEPVEQEALPEDFLQKETIHTSSEKETLPEGVESGKLPGELPPGVEVVIIDTPEIGEGLTDVFEGLDETENPGTEVIGSADNSGSQGATGKADSIIKETPFSVTYTETAEDGTEFTVKRTDYSAIIAVLWLGGMVSMFLYTAISYFLIYRRVRESAPLSKNVRVCDNIDSPFILGIVRPKIYLPSDINAADRVFVLAHERAHLKRFDHIWKPLGFLLLSIYWFHPLLWVAYVLLCKDIEYACDEKVIKELGAEQKKTYSTALINCSVSRKMISACPLAFGENGVKGRVKSVLHYKKPAFWVLVASVVICIIMAVCFLTDPKKEGNQEVTPTPIPDAMDTDYPIVSSALLEVNIPIDEAHFTSSLFREYLSKEMDLDKNGYLSGEERVGVRYLYLEAPIKTYPAQSSGFGVLDGFEYFPNLRYLCTNRAEQIIFTDHPSIHYVEVKGDVGYLYVEDCPKFKMISAREGSISAYYVSDVAEGCIYQYDIVNGFEMEHTIPLDHRCAIELDRQEELPEIRSTKTDAAMYYKEIPADWLERTENSIGIKQQFFEPYFTGKNIEFLKTHIYDKERDGTEAFPSVETNDGSAAYLWIEYVYEPADNEGKYEEEEEYYEAEAESDEYELIEVSGIPEGVTEDDLYIKTGQNFYVTSVTSWGDKGLNVLGNVALDIVYKKNGEEHKLATAEGYLFHVYLDKNGNGQFVRLEDTYSLLNHTPDVNEILNTEECFSSRALQRYLNQVFNLDGEEGLSKSEREYVYYLDYMNSVSLYKEQMDGLEYLPNLTDLYISSAESLVIDGHPSLEYIAGDASWIKKVIIKNCPKLKLIDLDLSGVEEVVIEDCHNLIKENQSSPEQTATNETTTNIPEYYNYKEMKSLLLEYLNHQAWLYPSEYPQDSYTCAYEFYRMTSDTTLQRVFLKADIKGKDYWFDFQQEETSNPQSPVRIVAREPQAERYIEDGSIVRIGSDSISVPAVKQPAYRSYVDFTDELSAIYAELKKNGYRNDLRIEAIVSVCDMEKKLFPYVYLIINDSEVYETTFTDEYSLYRTFYDDNFYIDYSLSYGTGNPWLFDGHGIKPLSSIDEEQMERVKACASFHMIEDNTVTLLLDREEIDLPKNNVTISERNGVGIAFVPQMCLSNTVHYNIYRSEDSGKNWRMIAGNVTATEGDIATILIPEKDTVVCYFELSGTTSQSSCIMSEDGGVTWEYITTGSSRPSGSISEPQKGSSVIFGAYEQDGNSGNGAEPLEWLVLDRDGDRALLLARYGIEAVSWDEEQELETWEVTNLYLMMNRIIYASAFSAEERKALIQTNPMEYDALSSSEERLLYKGYTFLLETDNVSEGKGQDETMFFPTEESRITIPTAAVVQDSVWMLADYSGAAAPWLLTVTGTTDGAFSEVEFARVMADGSISFGEEEVTENYVLIRPAIWVDVTKIPQ